MLKEEIVVGRAYVNEGACLIREVVEEVDSRHVRYNTFELDSGRWLPARHRVCSWGDMRRWADRLAQPDEQARIHPFAQEAALDVLSPYAAGSTSPDDARTAVERTPGARAFPQPK